MLGTSKLPVTFRFVVSTVVPERSSLIVKRVPEVPVKVNACVDDCTSSTMSVEPLIKSIFGNSAGLVEFLYGVISMFLAIGCYFVLQQFPNFVNYHFGSNRLTALKLLGSIFIFRTPLPITCIEPVIVEAPITHILIKNAVAIGEFAVWL